MYKITRETSSIRMHGSVAPTPGARHLPKRTKLGRAQWRTEAEAFDPRKVSRTLSPNA